MVPANHKLNLIKGEKLNTFMDLTRNINSLIDRLISKRTTQPKVKSLEIIKKKLENIAEKL